jgi:AAA+ superfamily predicted ATPase
MYVVTSETARFLQEFHSLLSDPSHYFTQKRRQELWYWSAGFGLRQITGYRAYRPDHLVNTLDDDGTKFATYSEKDINLMKETVIPSNALTHIYQNLGVVSNEGVPTASKRPMYRTIILGDFNYFAASDPQAVSMLKDIIEDENIQKRLHLNFIILSDRLEIPAPLNPYCEVVEFNLPGRVETEAIIRNFIDRFKLSVTSKKLDAKTSYTDLEVKALVDSCLGLSAYEMVVQMSKGIRSPGSILDPRFLMAAKEQLVKKSGILTFMSPNTSGKDIGGLNVLKDWFRQRKSSFSDEARAFGLESPKGVLLVGIPGTGKSLAAKCLGNEWGMPILHLDVGKVMSGLVGSSEAKIREVLATADASAPCILFVDEIEKSLSGTDSSNFSDAGTMARVFSSFLTWLQDHKTEVFVVATANNITQLPPELMRKGRFDEIFFVDLPGDEERKEIFDIHLSKRKQNPSDFDLEMLAVKSKGFSGSEIEQAVKDSMYVAFDSKDKKITTQILMGEIAKSIPLSESMKDMIDRVKNLASKVRFASDNSLHADLNPRKTHPVLKHDTSVINSLID